MKKIDNKTAKVSADERHDIVQSLIPWMKTHNSDHWKILDVAYRIAGTGSLGQKRYVLLIRDCKLKKYFLLDMKQSITSCLTPYVEISQPAWKNDAERIIFVQNVMQNVSPPILETLIHQDEPFVLKKLEPQADMMRLELCKGKFQKLEEVIENFAEISASAHLRSTGRLGSDTTDALISFFETSESWKSPLLEYAVNYAAQIKNDYKSFCKGK